MSATTLLTVEQFEQLPQEDGVRYELKDGELVQESVPMANAKFRHENTKAEILAHLVPFVVQHRLGKIYAETAFALSESLVCSPDMAFLTAEAVAKGDPEHIYRGAPDLAIEEISDSESAANLREKVQDYLNAGCKAVWEFYPTLGLIAVYDHMGTREVLGDQILEAPEILPGFRATASQFFK